MCIIEHFRPILPNFIRMAAFHPVQHPIAHPVADAAPFRPLRENHVGGSVATYPCGPEDSLPEKVRKSAIRAIKEILVQMRVQELMVPGQFNPHLEAELRAQVPEPQLSLDEARARFLEAIASWIASDIGLIEHLGQLEAAHAVNGSPFMEYLSHSRDLPKMAAKAIAHSDIDMDRSINLIGYLAAKLNGALREGSTLVYAPVYLTSNGFITLPLTGVGAEGFDLVARNLAPEGTFEWKSQMGRLVAAIFFEGQMLHYDQATENLHLIRLPDNKDRVTRLLLPHILREKIARYRDAILDAHQALAAHQGWMTPEVVEVMTQGYGDAIALYQHVIHLLEHDFDRIEFAGWRRAQLDAAIRTVFELLLIGQDALVTPEQIQTTANRVLNALDYDLPTIHQVTYYINLRAPSRPNWTQQEAHDLIKEVIRQVDTTSEYDRIALMTLIYATIERAKRFKMAAQRGLYHAAPAPPMHLLMIETFAVHIPVDAVAGMQEVIIPVDAGMQEVIIPVDAEMQEVIIPVDAPDDDVDIVEIPGPI